MDVEALVGKLFFSLPSVIVPIHLENLARRGLNVN